MLLLLLLRWLLMLLRRLRLLLLLLLLLLMLLLLLLRRLAREHGLRLLRRSMRVVGGLSLLRGLVYWLVRWNLQL